MARIQRQELKHDEFLDTFEELELYIEDNWRLLVTLVVGVMLTGGALGGFYFYSERQERRANAALAVAVQTFEAPVRQGLPPIPGDTQKSFSTEKEKFTAAAQEFAAVRTDYPRTRAARVAKHYEAVSRYQLGETDKAIAALEDLSRAADRNQAALARLHLAGIYAAQGKPAEAEKLYRQLVENPAATVPREVAQLALADFLAPTKPAEARQLYEQLKVAFPEGPLAEQVTRRLEALPATPASGPAQP